MEIQVAANFLAATLLVGTGIAYIGIVIVFLNNVIFKYWKYLGWFRHWNFIDDKNYPKAEVKEPTLGEIKSKIERK